MLSVSGLETREDRLPFAIGSRAHIVAPTVLGSPIAFVERGVGLDALQPTQPASALVHAELGYGDLLLSHIQEGAEAGR